MNNARSKYSRAPAARTTVPQCYRAHLCSAYGDALTDDFLVTMNHDWAAMQYTNLEAIQATVILGGAITCLDVLDGQGQVIWCMSLDSLISVQPGNEIQFAAGTIVVQEAFGEALPWAMPPGIYVVDEEPELF